MAKYDLETTTLGTLLDDPEARAIIVELVPDLPEHPMIGFAKMAGGQLPEDTLNELTTRIGAL